MVYQGYNNLFLELTETSGAAGAPTLPEQYRFLLCLPRPRLEQRGPITVWRAPAKLNLTLRIAGLRADGYHELDSVVSRITLYDELHFRPRADHQIRLECGPIDCGPIEGNLVWRAAWLLRQTAQEQGKAAGGVEIRLVKKTPPGAGLGGGSSDAATTLEALNQLWQLGLPHEALVEMGARLGSDVPLFLAPTPAVRMTGRGEQLQPANVRPFLAVLYLPNIACPTGEVYAAFDRQAGQVRPPSEQHPAAEEETFAGEPADWRIFNDLLPAAMEVAPPLGKQMQALGEKTRLPVHMTGSGSGLFVLVSRMRFAAEALDRLGEMRHRCRIVSMNPW